MVLCGVHLACSAVHQLCQSNALVVRLAQSILLYGFPSCICNTMLVASLDIRCGRGAGCLLSAPVLALRPVITAELLEGLTKAA